MNESMQPSSDWVDRWEPAVVVERLRAFIDLSPHVSDEVAHRLELTRRDVEAMTHLMRDEDIGPNELARRLGVSGPAATQIVNRLEQKGHVTRSAHSGDGRKTVVQVTPSARENALRQLIPMFVGFEAAAARLDARERAVIVQFLDDCIAAMRSVTEPEGAGYSSPADARAD